MTHHTVPEVARARPQTIEVLDEHFSARTARIDDDKVTGRQVAEAAGRNSIDEVIVLQQLQGGALEEIRPEELVDLREPGIERFFVIEGDATYRFFLDGLKLEWPRALVNAETLRHLVRKGGDFEIVHELEDAPDRVLGVTDVVDLSRSGTEKFKTRRATDVVTVFYGDKPFQLHKGNYTTERLIDIFKVEPGYLLDLWVDAKLVELKPGEHLELKAGMHFTSHPPRGQSS